MRAFALGINRRDDHVRQLMPKAVQVRLAVLPKLQASEAKAREAGIVKLRISVLLEPAAAAAALRRHFDAAELREIIAPTTA